MSCLLTVMDILEYPSTAAVAWNLYCVIWKKFVPSMRSTEAGALCQCVTRCGVPM